MYSQQSQHLAGSDSPSDAHHNHNQTILHHLYSQDSMYTMHDPQAGPYSNINSRSSMHIPSEYPTDFDAQKPHQQLPNKLNVYDSNNYRASFSSYPNTNHPRYQNSQSVLNSGSFRDPYTLYPSSNDVYTSQMTSPIHSHMQPYNSRASFDFGSAGQSDLSGAHKPYLDPYGPPSGMLAQSHGNPNNPQQQQGQQHNVYSTGSGTVSNGIQFSSQTPYGPHVPTTTPSSAANSQSAGAQSGGPPELTGFASMGMVNVAAGASNQEEISTIFVVGFPEDMQEREFQNMFTFSPGFEAATLKSPNKEYTVYGGIAGPSSRSYQTFTGPNDPCKLDTVNQGEVVVDDGQDGTMTCWPAVPSDDRPGSPFMGGGANAPPRKQVIGFARFRSREEALGARDVLQGRRVGTEEGAVLKVEMAKKNLHTKRGVSPVPVLGPGGVGAAGGMVVGALGGLPHGILGGAGLGGAPGPPDPYSMGSDSSLTSRKRELDALGTMGGLMRARSGSWRDQLMQRQEPMPTSANGVSVNHLNGFLTAEEKRRREREAGIINTMALGAGRGPRERADEEERERWRKERLRANNTTAFDAFYSVPMQQVQGLNQAEFSLTSQQLSAVEGSNINGVGSSLLLPSMENGGGSSLGLSPLEGGDREISRAMDQLALNINNGNTSPQLPPSPSGASWGSVRYGVDQNSPINTLYVGNLPTSPPPMGFLEDYLEESLRDLFSTRPGFCRLLFRRKSNGPMCFVEFEDVDFATKALNDLYGHTLNGMIKGGGIRLSYSKNPLGVRSPTRADSISKLEEEGQTDVLADSFLEQPAAQASSIQADDETSSTSDYSTRATNVPADDFFNFYTDFDIMAPLPMATKNAPGTKHPQTSTQEGQRHKKEALPNKNRDEPCLDVRPGGAGPDFHEQLVSAGRSQIREFTFPNDEYSSASESDESQLHVRHRGKAKSKRRSAKERLTLDGTKIVGNPRKMWLWCF